MKKINEKSQLYVYKLYPIFKTVPTQSIYNIIISNSNHFRILPIIRVYVINKWIRDLCCQKDQILPIVVQKYSWKREVIDVTVIITSNNLKELATWMKSVYNKSWPYFWEWKKIVKQRGLKEVRNGPIGGRGQNFDREPD